LRNQADYQLSGGPGRFATDAAATLAVAEAQDAIARLDEIEADPARRAAVIAGLRAAWP
jgi:hypothetical protein